MRQTIGKILRNQAIGRNRFVGLWRRLGSPSLEDWAEYLSRHGGFHSFGSACAINPSAYFADPAITRIGSNVRIAGGFITGHDGSVNMVNRAFGTKFDAVGAVDIRDNVFVGYGAIILPGVTIGENSIIGAGAVIARDVEPGSIMAGSPARKVSTMEEHLERLERKNAAMPWRHLIEQREGGFDPELEPELVRMRAAHFFGQRHNVAT